MQMQGMGNLKLNESLINELRQKKLAQMNATTVYLEIDDMSLVGDLFSYQSNSIEVTCYFESVTDIYNKLTNIATNKSQNAMSINKSSKYSANKSD